MKHRLTLRAVYELVILFFPGFLVDLLIQDLKTLFDDDDGEYTMLQ